MADTLIDGDFTVASQVGPSRFTQPIAAVNTTYLIEEDYWQLAANFTPLALSTAHPTYTGFVLVEESPTQSVGCGVVKWTRSYAIAPATHREPEMFPYSFIGLTIYLGAGGSTIRTRQLRTVKSFVQHDYFLLGVLTRDPITGATFTPSATGSGGDIPTILAQQYVSQATYGGALYGGETMAVDSLNLAAAVLPTWPTSEQYQTMMADAATNGWNANLSNVVVFPTSTLVGGPPPTGGHMVGAIDTAHSVLGGQICAEESKLDRWRGQIFLRRTRFVLVQ